MLSSYSQSPVFSNKHSIQKLIETTAITFGGTRQLFVVLNPLPATKTLLAAQGNDYIALLLETASLDEKPIHIYTHRTIAFVRVTRGKQNMAQHST